MTGTEASAPKPLAMHGQLADESLSEFLAAAANLNMYARVQIAGGVRDGSIVLASGRVVLENAEDVMSRRIAQHKAVELIRKNHGGPGTYVCMPLVNMPAVDSTASVSVDELLRAAHQHDRAPEASLPAQSPLPAATPTPPTLPPSTLEAPPAVAPSVVPIPTPPAMPAVDGPVHEQSAIRPMRASQLRKMLRESRASLDGEDGATGVEEVRNAGLESVVSNEDDEHSRSEALRSIIRRLAS